MAFSSVICGKTVFGNKVVHSGCWTAASVTTGSIDTGLASIDTGSLGIYSEVAGTSTITVVPSGTCITLTALEQNHCGGWFAWGKRK